nr:MAG TPA: hypothetical protein [Caudoviricetes sp.]
MCEFFFIHSSFFSDFFEFFTYQIYHLLCINNITYFT